MLVSPRLLRRSSPSHQRGAVATVKPWDRKPCPSTTCACEGNLWFQSDRNEGFVTFKGACGCLLRLQLIASLLLPMQHSLLTFIKQL